MDKNNERENSLRVNYEYQVGDKVLVTDMTFTESWTILQADPTTLYKYIQVAQSDYRKDLWLRESISDIVFYTLKPKK